MKAVKRYKKGGKMCSCGKMPAGMCDCGGKMDKYSNGGLYANIHAKRARGERMRNPGEKGAPTAQDFKNAAKTAKK